MRSWVSAVLVLGLVAIAAAHESPRDHPEAFSVSGYVIDLDGNLVSGAEVYVMPVDRGGLVLMGITTAGRFSIPLDGPGRYRLYAFKNDMGYKTISEALFTMDPEGCPEVIINEQTPQRNAVIRLRQGSANLKLRLTDSATGEAPENTRVVVSRRYSRGGYVRPLTSLDKGEIRLILPSLPLTIEASAPGYETWSYTERHAEKQTNTLLLVPGETREITVQLRRIRKGR